MWTFLARFKGSSNVCGHGKGEEGRQGRQGGRGNGGAKAERMGVRRGR